MGIDDRIENKTEDAVGRGKEAAGAAMGDDSLKAEGRTDQARASVKEKVEDAKDKVRETVDKVL